MSNSLGQDIFRRFGPLTLGAALAGSLAVWALAHYNAAPGGVVKVLWGLVEYTKKTPTSVPVPIGLASPVPTNSPRPSSSQQEAGAGVGKDAVMYGAVATSFTSTFVPLQFVTITQVAPEMTIEFTLDGEKPDGAYAYIETESGLYPVRATAEGPIWIAKLQLGPIPAIKGSSDCDVRYNVKLITVSDEQVRAMNVLIAKGEADGWKKGFNKSELPSGLREVNLPLALKRNPDTCVPPG